MEVFKLLFSDWVGILSLFTIVFIIGMAVFFLVYFISHMQHDARVHKLTHHDGH